MCVHRGENRRWILLALSVALAGCSDDGAPAAERGAVTSGSSAVARTTAEAGGEVASDSTRPVVRWLDDANALALVNVMNGRQLAAADAELSTWHVDTVRAFAAELARGHAALQRSIDSAAEALKIMPVTPALAPLVRARMQAQIDSMYEHGGRAFDRAYVDQAVVSHRLMQQYLDRLSAAVTSSALHDVLTTASDTVKAQLRRATALRGVMAAADSAAADSAAKRAARRAARLNGATRR